MAGATLLCPLPQVRRQHSPHDSPRAHPGLAHLLKCERHAFYVALWQNVYVVPAAADYIQKHNDVFSVYLSSSEYFCNIVFLCDTVALLIGYYELCLTE